MTCAWQELLSLLPPEMQKEVNRIGRDTAQEIRLRIGHVPELVCGRRWERLPNLIRREDLTYVINSASRYSPWSAQTLARGYITGPGGHRVGVCGEVVMKDGYVCGLRRVTSLCIRIARDFPGIAEDACHLKGSILIIGPPGSGKTTLLRDLIRQISIREVVGVVDERGELFPDHVTYGTRLDVLKGCPKREGMEMILRTMGSSCIAMDEITASSDCDALLQAGWCGVRLLATAHAGSMQDLMKRPLYQPLLRYGLFDHILVMNKDKTWRKEQMIA